MSNNFTQSAIFCMKQQITFAYECAARNNEAWKQALTLVSDEQAAPFFASEEYMLEFIRVTELVTHEIEDLGLAIEPNDKSLKMIANMAKQHSKTLSERDYLDVGRAILLEGLAVYHIAHRDE